VDSARSPPARYSAQQGGHVIRTDPQHDAGLDVLLAAPVDRLSQAVTCLVFAGLLSRDQHALIGDDITDDILGQRRVAKHQQRLPVQRDRMTLVDNLPASLAGRRKGVNRARFVRFQHRQLRTSRRRCA
jgi:hypothetical protein